MSEGAAPSPGPAAILTAASAGPSLRPYGHLVTFPAGATPLVDTAACRFWPALAPVDVGPDGAEVGWCRVVRRPALVTRLERHRRSAELMAPIDGDMVVPVAAPSGAHDPPSGAVGILVRVGEALVVHRSVWHWAAFPVREASAYWVLFRQGTSSQDVETRDLDQPVRLADLPPDP
ncbi:MAG TPA: ureidoglycolate lyase [Candidatus Dormibacteraeota bacterium]|nr:ureidoglycolate lyase [Candidatus Dormibacteraeota bacterium]